VTHLDRLRVLRDQQEALLAAEEDSGKHASLSRVYADLLDRIAALEKAAAEGSTGAGVDGLADSAKGKLRAVPGSGRR
jgi:hypothetical protein